MQPEPAPHHPITEAIRRALGSEHGAIGEFGRGLGLHKASVTLRLQRGVFDGINAAQHAPDAVATLREMASIREAEAARLVADAAWLEHRAAELAAAADAIAERIPAADTEARQEIAQARLRVVRKSALADRERFAHRRRTV